MLKTIKFFSRSSAEEEADDSKENPRPKTAKEALDIADEAMRQVQELVKEASGYATIAVEDYFEAKSAAERQYSFDRVCCEKVAQKNMCIANQATLDVRQAALCLSGMFFNKVKEAAKRAEEAESVGNQIVADQVTAAAIDGARAITAKDGAFEKQLFAAEYAVNKARRAAKAKSAMSPQQANASTVIMPQKLGTKRSN